MPYKCFVVIITTLAFSALMPLVGQSEGIQLEKN